MKNFFWLFLFTLINSFNALAAITFVADTNPTVNEDTLQNMTPEQKEQYCQESGYKLLTCSDPYQNGEACSLDNRYIKECQCLPEYNKDCLETEGLKGIDIRCNGKYKQCCRLLCRNPRATLLSCKDQDLEEVHSERDYNECGDICYVCKDKCTQGTPEDQCPEGLVCHPLDGIKSQQGQNCCQCGCPSGQKNCKGKCIDENQCCVDCPEGFQCKKGKCAKL